MTSLENIKFLFTFVPNNLVVLSLATIEVTGKPFSLAVLVSSISPSNTLTSIEYPPL